MIALALLNGAPGCHRHVGPLLRHRRLILSVATFEVVQSSLYLGAYALGTVLNLILAASVQWGLYNRYQHTPLNSFQRFIYYSWTPVCLGTDSCGD